MNGPIQLDRDPKFVDLDREPCVQVYGAQVSVLLSARELTHGFGARPLFQGISFTLCEGDRVGLIGPNGAGKSTLLKILSHQILPDRGEVVRRSGLKIATLEQVPMLTGPTVRDAVRDGLGAATGWEVETTVDEWINRLELDPTVPVEQLSGGWRKRAALARALVQTPDLLLLDEPTNHLDVESILWLERFLCNARLNTLTVTHDRLFLQRISTRILELDPRNPFGLLDVAGDYATYLERKQETLAVQERKELTLRNTLRRETEWLRRGAKARTTKQEARIQRASTLAAEVTELGVRNRKANLDLDFQGSDPSQARAKRLIEARGLGKHFSGHTVFEGVDLLITPKTRLGLMGPNGCGKSTLLRVLIGEAEPSQGEIFRSDGLRVAYFEQNRSALDPQKTLAESVAPDSDHVVFRGTSLHRNGYLERFLFRSEQMVQPVSSLSGGEQSRLWIACLMLQPANVLILDEPTNDLDLQTLSVLEEALLHFDGAVLLVTHDRYFLDQVATQILAFHTAPGQAGQLTAFADLAQWEAWHATQQASSSKSKNPLKESTSPPKRKKLSFKDQRDWDTLEERILLAEERVAALEAECALPEVATDADRLTPLHAELVAAREAVDSLYARWAELETSLSE